MNTRLSHVYHTNERFDLRKSVRNLSQCYDFLDDFVRKFSRNDEIYIRQVTSSEDLKKLSDARRRMYGQREDYFQKMYEGEYCLDELDLNSYLFACFHKGEIIGIQRVARYPFEVASYISHEALASYFGNDYKTEYIEFSRLVVDKEIRVRGVSNLLVIVAGTIVSLASGIDKHFTYSRPRLKQKSFLLDSDVLKFKIDKRNDYEYQIFKGTLKENIKRVFSLNGESREEIMDDLKLNIEQFNLQGSEVSAC